MQELSKWTGKELNIIDNFTSAERANTHNNTNTSQCNGTQASSAEDCKENISTKKRSQPKSTKKVNSSAEPVSSHIIDTIVSGSPLTSISRTNKILLGGKKKNGITIHGNPITGKLEIIGNPIDIQKSILKHRRVNHTLGIRPPIDRIVLGGQTQPIPTITRTIDKSRNVVTSRIIGPISLLAKKK